VDAGAAVEWKIGRISLRRANGNPDQSKDQYQLSYRNGASGSIFQSAALWFESTGSKDGFSSANMAVGAPVVLTFTAGAPQWNVDFNGSWGTASNWSGGIPNGPTAVANFLGKSQRREP